MKTKSLHILAVVAFALVALGVSVRAAIVTPIYAIANLSFGEAPLSRYQFGVFDLGSPIGSPGSYQYAWTSLGGISNEPLANLALNPVTSQLYLQYDFNQYRAIGTDGTLGADLGAMSTLFGMAFDGAGGLYGTHSDNWYTLDGSNGSINSTSVLAANFYSQFGGGLTYAADGNFYFGDPFSLYSITPGGVESEIGNFSGTGFAPFGWIAMFSSGANTYLLNADRLYQVDLSDASLDLLGAVTGLPPEFALGFSGAAGIASAPAPAIPEPGTWAAAAFLLGTAGYVRWRRSRQDVQA